MGTSDAEPKVPPRDPAESIRRNAVFALAVKLSGAFFTGILTLYLVRALNPSGYGVFTIAVSIASLMLLFSDFGISASTSRFIAERRGDSGGIARILGDALSLKLVAATAVSAALFAAAGPIADAYGNQDLFWPMRLIAFAVLGQSMLYLFSGVFEAIGRNVLGFRLITAESAVETTASIGLVVLGAGATGAAAGRAIGMCFGGLLGVVMAIRAIRPARLRVGRQAQWGYRPIFSYAVALLVIEGAFAVYTQIDTILIGAILSTTAAGLFGAALKLILFAQFPGLAFAGGVAPRLARHPDHPPNVEALQTGLGYLIVLQFALVPPLLVWAEPLTRIVLGPDYGGSVVALQFMAPYVFLAGISPLLALSVNYFGEARRRVIPAVATVVLNAILDVVLINALGIKGASLATDAAILFYALAHLRICIQMLGLELSPILGSFLRSGLAALAMAAVLFGFGTSDLGAAQLILGAILASATYLAVLLATAELTPGQLQSAWAYASDRFRRQQA
jgi:O-antigen/teichoic acid export membrane protein